MNRHFCKKDIHMKKDAQCHWSFRKWKSKWHQDSTSHLLGPITVKTHTGNIISIRGIGTLTHGWGIYKTVQLLYPKITNSITAWASKFSFWVYTQKNSKQGLKEIPIHSRSQQHYSQQLKHGSNPSVHWEMNG